MLGTTRDFRRQESAWSAVAGELAVAHQNREGLTINRLLADLGGHLATVLVFAGVEIAVCAGAQSPALTLEEILLKLVEALTSAGGSLLSEAIGLDIEREKLRETIERCVQFRCVRVPIPISLPREPKR